jgi:hypothetical protein
MVLVAVALGLPGLRATGAEPNTQPHTTAPAPTARELEQALTDTVRPFMASFCTGCHGPGKKKADVDLSPYTKVATVVRDQGVWEGVLDKIASKQMPPENAAEQPTPEARQKVIAWIEAVRWSEARRTAGDPGPVLARRLSNAEYNYTVRDLTGVDIRPTREFPVDPANPAGFDNSSESLAMSPALLAKYLQAAREVASHLVLKPDAMAFAPHPMLVETDRDKYCVQQIIGFYQAQATDYADYFQAAWRFKHRAALGQGQATLADIAAQSKVSPKYLALVWRTLEEQPEEVGPIAKLQKQWRALPAPTAAAAPDAARPGSEKMRDFVVGLRRKIEVRIPPLSVPGVRANSQPLLMWKNRQYASSRTSYNKEALQIDGKALVASAPTKTKKDENADNDEEADEPVAPMKQKGVDPDLVVPAAERVRYEAAFARFAAVFPDNFYVSERGRNYLDKSKDKGRYLSAGFHNLMGYFRDDQPLYDLVLDQKGQKELDGLWRELDYVASAMHRTYIQFFLSESGEARGRAAGEGRVPDEDITSEVMVKKIKDIYLTKARPSGNQIALKAITDHFDTVNATLRWVEKARLQAEPKHLAALTDFAERAYRRPLSAGEKRDLTGYYRSLRKNGLPHDEAMRDSIVGVLMSPDFCYRLDLGLPQVGSRTMTVGHGLRPLSDYALASRLSYFLWSSAPDAELLARAKAGDLHRPQVLIAQARRMLADGKVRGLATEFGGNWLDFRRFEEHNAVDRERFPSFNNDLRQAMFEEPVRFMLDVFQQNRPVLDFLYAKHTFVNATLAKHYGMPEVKSDAWVRVEDAEKYGRGGLLPMSVFLTKNAPGLRTSPVKRGYWVVKTVLGERIPPPPAAVPELPRDEAKADLPLRQLLARHREDPSCSGCHARFDSMGLVLEGYGPIGEKRAKDLAGRPVEATASFPGGRGEGTGLAGLREYVRSHRQSDFLDNLARKLLAYALSRSLTLSDEPTIQEMRARLERDGYRFDSLVESIVTSKQFLNKRTPTTLAQRTSP